MKIKYLFPRGSLNYYQRKIPLDVVHFYNGAKNVKVNLKTTDIRAITEKIMRLNKLHEAQWAALRINPIITPPSIRAEALKLLDSFGLKPNPAENNEHQLDQLFKVFEGKALEYVEGDEHELLDTVPKEFLSNVELEALRLLNEKPQFRLSDALPIYFDTHKSKYDEKFRAYQTRGWLRLIGAIGDKRFDELTRADGRAFIDKMLSDGVKTTTAERNLGIASAVFNAVSLEKDLAISNPFKNIKIGGLGHDTEGRVPFDAEQLRVLKAKCIEIDDDIRWLLALQADLGCRIAEAAGLALADLHVDAEIPYLTFKVHPWRRLKTKGSVRDVPLVGLALWAAHRIVDTATKEQLYAFPRYTDGKTCKADTASATCNKFIRGLGIDRTTHELRHTMRDRLRDADAPSVLQDAVGGWGKTSLGENYGLGESIGMLKRWLDKVV